MKKIMILIIMILGMVGVIYMMIENHNSKKESGRGEQSNVFKQGKVAVIYFSATGTTKDIAEKISSVTEGTLIEIVPKERYTSNDLNYGNDNSRANREQNDSSARPEIENKMDLSSYDVIYLGYPIWWGDVPKIILTFLDNHDLSGKTVIPFCTSGGSSIDTSLETLKNYDSNISWKAGKRFDTEAEKEIRNWVNQMS